MDKFTLPCTYQPKDRLIVECHAKHVRLCSEIFDSRRETTIVLSAPDIRKLRDHLLACLIEIERLEPVPSPEPKSLTADDVRLIVREELAANKSSKSGLNLTFANTKPGDVVRCVDAMASSLSHSLYVVAAVHPHSVTLQCPSGWTFGMSRFIHA
jgi:hypothetical protein